MIRTEQKLKDEENLQQFKIEIATCKKFSKKLRTNIYLLFLVQIFKNLLMQPYQFMTKSSSSKKFWKNH
jgi:hypothetical protein